MKTRREFIKTACLGIAAGAAWRSAWGQSVGRAYVSEAAFADDPSREQLRAALDTTVQQALLARTPEAAWRSLVEPHDVVAVKICADAPLISTTHRLLDEIVLRMISVDVLPENILIWDKRSDDLYRYDYAPPDAGERRPQILASEGVEGTIRRVGYDEAVYIEDEDDLAARRTKDGAFSFFSRIVTQLATKIISVPTLRYHPITGIYGGMASLALGSLSNTFRFHPTGGEGIPVIADAWRNTPLIEKHALTIVDGLVGAYDTGPGYAPEWFWDARRLFVSEDPVALDSILVGVVNEQRKSPLRPVYRNADYLRQAASVEIGINDTDDIVHEKNEIP